MSVTLGWKQHMSRWHYFADGASRCRKFTVNILGGGRSRSPFKGELTAEDFSKYAVCRECFPSLQLSIVEGISGMWFYHLAPAVTSSLCGKLTMSTPMALEQWRSECGNDRIRYKWCPQCEILGRDFLKP